MDLIKLLLTAGALLLSGCAYNINTIEPVDIAAVKPVVGSSLAMVKPPAAPDDATPVNSFTPEQKLAFERSGVFSRVTEVDSVPVSGYAVAVTRNVVSNTFYPDDIGPIGALIQIPLMAFVPWQTTTEFSEQYEVYHQSRLLHRYTVNYNCKGMVSWNPIFMLFGKPGGWCSQADDAYLASRHVAWVLTQMQKDGYLGIAK